MQDQNDSGAIRYVEPTPPDKNHTFVVTVYALEAELALRRLLPNRICDGDSGRVLATVTLEGIYKNRSLPGYLLRSFGESDWRVPS